MNVERRTVQIPQHEYVITLSPDEAGRLHEIFRSARWDQEFCRKMQDALGAACNDALRRVW